MTTVDSLLRNLLFLFFEIAAVPFIHLLLKHMRFGVNTDIKDSEESGDLRAEAPQPVLTHGGETHEHTFVWRGWVKH